MIIFLIKVLSRCFSMHSDINWLSSRREHEVAHRMTGSPYAAHAPGRRPRSGIPMGVSRSGLYDLRHVPEAIKMAATPTLLTSVANLCLINPQRQHPIAQPLRTAYCAAQQCANDYLIPFRLTVRNWCWLVKCWLLVSSDLERILNQH
jgi:hypothetical protein